MIKLFTEHPEEQGETYSEHCCFAVRCGLKLILAGLAAVTHGVFPFLFTTTASELANNTCSEFQTRTK